MNRGLLGESPVVVWSIHLTSSGWTLSHFILRHLTFFFLYDICLINFLYIIKGKFNADTWKAKNAFWQHVKWLETLLCYFTRHLMRPGRQISLTALGLFTSVVLVNKIHAGDAKYWYKNQYDVCILYVWIILEEVFWVSLTRICMFENCRLLSTLKGQIHVKLLFVVNTPGLLSSAHALGIRLRQEIPFKLIVTSEVRNGNLKKTQF